MSGEVTRMTGKPRKRGQREHVPARVDKAVRGWLQAQAAEVDMPLGSYISHLLEMHVLATQGVSDLEDLPDPPLSVSPRLKEFRP